jgi:hypothetical protein
MSIPNEEEMDGGDSFYYTIFYYNPVKKKSGRWKRR